MRKTFMGLLTTVLLMMSGISLADKTVYVEPGPGDIREDEAIELAKMVLCENFQGVEDFIDAYTSEAYLGYLQPPFDEPIWLVGFYSKENESYFVKLSRQGNILSFEAPSGQPYYPGDDEMTSVTFTEPGPHDISEQEAIQIARNSLHEIGGYQTRMDKLTTKAYFLYSDRYNNGWEPVWLIYFFQDDVLQQKMLLGYEGSYIDTVSAGYQFSQTIRRNYISTAGGEMRFYELGFWDMTHEERAEFSKKWIPLVEEFLAANPYTPSPGDEFYMATRCIYGVPGKTNISEDDAVKIAGDFIETVRGEKFDTQCRGAFFDITNSANPKWKFLIASGNTYDNFKLFKVIIDADLGNVTDYYVITGDMVDYNY
ncbi:MAG: hypothetical protein FWF69_05990 [Firmicutes bacterium]|nr:hypothetical protein [Bacillota bacterium]